MMLTLAFESSAKAASVALCRDEELIAQSFQAGGLTHSRTLLPMAEDLLKNTETRLEDIGCIAVSHGPGSFTGVRIGVSTVKGLAWAADKPVVGVSTLEAMAWNALYAPEDSLICCAMDARRAQVYNAVFRLRGESPVRLCGDRAVSLDELAADMKKYENPAVIVGDGALLCYNHLRQAGVSAVLAPEHIRYQCAWGVAMAARGVEPGSPDDLIPVYLRLSQAERERQAKLDKRQEQAYE